MVKPKVKKLFFLGILLFLIFWSLHQIYDLVYDDGEKQDPTMLLYEVSLFQFELLHHFLSEAAAAETTADLNVLKQALYSANYTHEHLMLAVGTKHLQPLQSTSELMQYILRLQIGGDRTLTGEELQILSKVSESYKLLFSFYEDLISKEGEVNPAHHERLIEIDRNITGIIEAKLLD